MAFIKLPAQSGAVFTGETIIEGNQIIDDTSTEAFLVRKDGDGGDVLIVDTTNSRVGIGVAPVVTLTLPNGGVMGLSTSNGSDNSEITINGGGGGGSGRGASMQLDGNERGSNPGVIFFTAGNVVGGNIRFGTGGTNDIMIITYTGKVGIKTATPSILLAINDDDTGLDLAAADQLSLVAGGIEGHRITEAASVITHNLTGKVGIDRASPDSALHIKSSIPGTIGDKPAGQIIIQSPTNDVNTSTVITAYKSDGNGDPDVQLWYLGSSSSSNEHIIFLNRRNADLALGTNDTTHVTLEAAGNLVINNYTQLGSAAPVIKMKKITGTTDADSETAVAHGLTLSKILSVDIIVVGSTISVAPNYFTSADTNYYAYHMNATNVVMTSVQAGVQSGAYTILITYEA